MPVPTTLSERPHYSAFSMPRYVDSNPRPSKSPRQSVHSSGSLAAATDSSSEYRYGPYGRTATADGASSSSSQSTYPPPSSWTTATATATATTTTTTTASSDSNLAYADPRPYSFAHEPYKTVMPPLKSEAGGGSLYPPGSRGSFDSMNNYSWSTA
ncbi:hypothetical protein L249_4548 [Ophiocordyceps polyrhachis-furcata BCC 54312]|uniref:Uncharacterized protein n=1 Tax=Ophiocordyceps polyrhachis-furcata BCC 54312 TaxID=1330021 RepID=A0A367KZ44_9HYPO|nr:hypothetical protein L249_4548 [Ophiocordyceps polyrhachis-furcata BCC 54312]